MRMFTISIMVILFISIIINTMQACPTCIGRLEADTPPFFSNEFDEHYQMVDNDKANHEGEDDDDVTTKPRSGK